MSEAETYKVLLEINKNLGSLNASVITIDEKLDRACESISNHDKTLIRHESDIHQLKTADQSHKNQLDRIERILTKDMIPLVQTVRKLRKVQANPTNSVVTQTSPPDLQVAYEPPTANFWQRLPNWGKAVIIIAGTVLGIAMAILSYFGVR